MRPLVVIFVFLLGLLAGNALAQQPGSGAIAACSSGSPSPDRSTISPVGAGQYSCVLIDYQGNRWRFSGTWMQVAASGNSSFNDFSHLPLLEINSGGHVFTQISCGASWSGAGPFTLWVENGSYSFTYPVASPTSIPSPPFVDGATSYGSFYGLMNSGNVRNGDTITVGALARGIPVWYGGGRMTKSNLTIRLTGALGCAVDEGNAILPVDAGGGSVSGLTITGGEIGYAHDPDNGAYRCINMASSATSNWTISDTYIHDCDFGLQGNTEPAGSVGAITNVVWEHHGNKSSGGASASHNVYLGGFHTGNTSTLRVSGGGSYCTDGHDDGPGFQFKTRWVGGSFQNWTAAEPSQHGYTDCAESAAVDLSCGGHYTLGGAGAGQGVVLEVGPGLAGNGHELVRYGRDDRSGNCGAGGAPWSDTDCNSAFAQNCQLVIQNCWLISDATIDVSVVTIDGTIPANRVTVKNCKLVGNASSRIRLGAGVIDGGGNLTYANRAAAGLPAYPALPLPP